MALAAVFVVLTLALSMFRFLDNDEIEHLHSAWLVFSGGLPYVDFFQHHHSLLWYCLAPLLAVTGQSASAVITFRLLYFLLTLAILGATYRLALECRQSRADAWLSVLLLVSMTTFTYVAIEIRPDVPQVLFGVLSAIFLVRLCRSGAARDAAWAGAFAAVAFLFLQKAVVVLACYPIAFAVCTRRPWRAALRPALAFAAAFAAACLPFAAYLAATGSADEYVIANWRLIPYIPAGRARISFLSPVMLRDFARNAVFWGLVLGATVALLRRRMRTDFTVPAVLGLGTVAILFVLNHVADRYLVAAMPFLAVAAAAWLSDVLDAGRAGASRTLAILLVVCLLPGAAMLQAVGRSNRPQLARIQYVLDHSRPDERMFDPWRDYNLFRPDAHFFWFHAGAGGRQFSRMSGGRVADHDVCGLLETAKPPFVSDRRSDLARCGLGGAYRPTPFDRFVERVGR